jgi:predicted small integral membrane protein
MIYNIPGCKAVTGRLRSHLPATGSLLLCLLTAAWGQSSWDSLPSAHSFVAVALSLFIISLEGTEPYQPG